MALKLGKRLSHKRCKYDREWQIYECGYPHSSLFGRLSCSQCRNKGTLCASQKHPANRRRDEW